MRNFIIHSYVKVSPSRLWESTKNDIPALFMQIRHLLGVYGDGWIPCTSLPVPFSDKECVGSILECIRQLKNVDVQYVNEESRHADIFCQHAEAGKAASLLSRPFRLANPQIDWHSIVANSEKIASCLSHALFPSDELDKWTRCLIDSEDKLEALSYTG